MIQTHKVGDLLSFGEIDWVVLNILDEKMLLITREIIEKRPFHQSYDSVNWDTCSLRAYLNGDFIRRFCTDDLTRIARGKNSDDTVFLLSVEEANLYFADDLQRIAHFRGTPRWWYLRTTGIGNHVAFVDKDGTINTHGCRVDNPYCGVRAAIYLKMN